MTTELYKDQFTPWVKNHWAGDGTVPADILGGAILGNLVNKDAVGLTHATNILYAAITTNYYLGMFQGDSTKSEVQ